MSLEYDLILASRSPRRRELLKQIGVRFEVKISKIEELRGVDEDPEYYVQRLALEKAQACASQAIPVLGSDTTVVIDDEVLEKPRDQNDAADMLAALSDRTHDVITAVSLVQGLSEGNSRDKTIISRSKVTFRSISRDEALAYWHTGEPADKAGGYAIQGLGAVFVKDIRGSYSGIMGLPLFETAQLLREFNVPVWRL